MFLKVWRPRCSSKKTAPGNSRFKPTNSILQGIVCKILLGWENHWGFDYKTENHRGFLKIQKSINFPNKNLNRAPRPKCTIPCPIFFKMGPPSKQIPPLDFFLGNKSDYTEIRARATHPWKIRNDQTGSISVRSSPVLAISRRRYPYMCIYNTYIRASTATGPGEPFRHTKRSI